MSGTTPDGMRNASDPPARHGITCASCGAFTLTAIEGLFSNPRVGSPQRFCSPACRAAAWRRRQAGVHENTPRHAPAVDHAACAPIPRNPKPQRPPTRRQYEATVPNVADRVAQTAAAMLLEAKLEPVFHPDSYGYRPGRSAQAAVEVCRRRCWEHDWVIDCDIRAFFDSVPHDLLMKAVAHHTSERWVLLYIERWLKAPMQMPDGTLTPREKGTPQGSLCAAAHKPPNEQRLVMRSVGLSVLVRAGAGAER